MEPHQICQLLLFYKTTSSLSDTISKLSVRKENLKYHIQKELLSNVLNALLLPPSYLWRPQRILVSSSCSVHTLKKMNGGKVIGLAISYNEKVCSKNTNRIVTVSVVITARVRSTREGNVFTLFVSLPGGTPASGCPPPQPV